MPAIAALVALICITCDLLEPVTVVLKVTPSPLPEESPVAFPGLTLSYSWRLGRLEILEPNRLEHVALPPCGTSTGTRPEGLAAGGMRSPEFDASAGKTTNNVNPTIVRTAAPNPATARLLRMTFISFLPLPQ